MRRERILLILGIWVAILPYLGFPYFWKNIMFTLSGIILIYHSYALHKIQKAKEKRKKSFDNFSENNLDQSHDDSVIVKKEEVVRLD
jgi:hypothetical protein